LRLQICDCFHLPGAKLWPSCAQLASSGTVVKPGIYRRAYIFAGAAAPMLAPGIKSNSPCTHPNLEAAASSFIGAGISDAMRRRIPARLCGHGSRANRSSIAQARHGTRRRFFLASFGHAEAQLGAGLHDDFGTEPTAASSLKPNRRNEKTFITGGKCFPLPVPLHPTRSELTLDKARRHAVSSRKVGFYHNRSLFRTRQAEALKRPCTALRP